MKAQQIVYEIAAVERASEVAAVMEAFIEDEPMLNAMNLDVAEVRPALLPWVRNLLSRGLTIVAVDKAADDKVIGVQTNVASVRNATDDDEKLLLRHWFPNPAVTELESLLGRTEEEAGVHDRYDAHSVATVGHLVVARSYRRRGIAERLMLSTMHLLKEKGFVVYSGIGTSVFSQAIFKKLHFDVCNEVDYEKHLSGELFDVAKLRESGLRALVVYAKKIA